MSVSEYKSFGEKLAFHSAPTLLGIKCASLISLSVNEFDIDVHSEMFNRKAVAKGLKSKVLCKCGEKALFFVYSEKLLEKRFCDPAIREVLCSCGYSEALTVDECLERLSQRIRRNGEFPHEIGIFLGYPLEDVLGFIENKGGNFKLCGCWKVYGCEESARRTFANYEKCRRFLCNKLNEGADIYQALKIS
ncbi:MAG: DUF3793 family protein [Ruminococcus sp.]|nr:DUF3793 family protein [Ruminococcus sp.]